MAAKPHDSLPGSNAPTRPGDTADLDLSVAGEEDPGASFDLPANPPGGTTDTGESVCPQCGGNGRLGGSTCPICQGKGKVIAGIGGA
ncbi:MAG TPA: hypothetical protein VF522_10380 [Ramlibacter sp.]|uniref:hypothetical protein n=1 Tax=Ramlibacter sp. TaxID=1917967 RepID=UPI002ED334C7